MLTVGFYSAMPNGDLTGDAFCEDCTCDAEARGVSTVDWQAIYYWDEADTPTHCVKCETLIAHALTPDGYAYVLDYLAESTGRPEILAEWDAEYGTEARDLAGRGEI